MTPMGSVLPADGMCDPSSSGTRPRFATHVGLGNTCGDRTLHE